MDEYYLEAEMRGRRSTMEDAHTHHCGPEYLEATEPCMFGVFDGHGGDECARFLAQNLCPAIGAHPNYFDDPVRALDESFVTIDTAYCRLAQQLDLEDGSTATVLLLHYDEKSDALKYYLAQAGDSRAIIIRNDGSTRCLVEDHNPTRQDERDRIQQDGGEVLYDADNDIWRVASAVGGGLAVTRAFGDFYFKPFVTARPEIVKGELSEEDAYICLASDGLWNDVPNDEVGKAILERGSRRGTQYVIETAFGRGSDDNITVIVVNVKIGLERLREEAKRRPANIQIPKRLSTKTNSRRLSPSHRVTSADEGAGTPITNGEDPLILSMARKISAVATPKLMSSTDVDFVEIPGIPTRFSNDLVLWRDPIVSFLWFALINGLFILSVYFGYSLVTVISVTLLFRMLSTFTVARIAGLLKKFGVIKEDFDTEHFISRNQVVSGDTIRYFANAILGTIIPIVDKWNDLVVRGSTTNILITLRTLTYLYTPIPIAVLAWVLFLLIFTVPATYARHKETIDDVARNITTTTSEVLKPHLDRVKTQLSGLDGLRAKLSSIVGGKPSDGDIGAGPKGKKTIHDKLGIGQQLSEEL